MKSIKFSILAVAAAIALSTFSGCTGETGATGPAGPSGANGVSGLTTTNYTIGFSSWVSNGSGTDQWYVNTNQAIPISDVAEVYYSLTGTGYSPLPASSVFISGDYLTFTYSNTGGLTIWYNNSPSPPAQAFYVNVADIPPSMIKQYPKTNWKNYNEVCLLPGAMSAHTGK